MAFDIESLDSGKHVAVEDFLPGWLSRALPDGVTVRTRIEEGDAMPYLLVMEVDPEGVSAAARRGGDDVDVVEVELHAFCEGLDAERACWKLLWASFKLVEEWARKGRRIGSAASFLVGARLLERPRRRPDWADATGPVQYQDLPVGIERFVARARLTIINR